MKTLAWEAALWILVERVPAHGPKHSVDERGRKEVPVFDGDAGAGFSQPRCALQGERTKAGTDIRSRESNKTKFSIYFLPSCAVLLDSLDAYNSKHGRWAGPAPPLRRLSDTVSSDPPLRDEPKRDLREAPKAHREAKNLVSGDRACYARSVESSHEHLPRLSSEMGSGRVPGKYDKNTLSEVSASSDEIWEADQTRFSVGGFQVLAVIEQLDGTKTTEHNVLEWFPCLEVWFEKTDVSKCYIYWLPPEIAFTSPETTRISPFHPHPARYLCQGCPVFWGIDKQDSVIGDLGVLAEDGSSAEVLSGTLLKYMNQPIRQAVVNLEALLHLPGIVVSDSVAIDTYLD
ncbi:hypothetical protein EDD85DRAFT_789715 [Armillaria nabsnona]|nr:hypothetical protein EDD85DRAFT_789715 [Armillaria nabsnona]